jgi:tetrahydromethanopterin S-methyltransferase subunit F
MSKYNTFLLLFVISSVAAILFFIFYMQAIFGFMGHVREYSDGASDPLEVFSNIFTPQVIFSIVVAAVAGLAYRTQGIVLVARNKTVKDGEKALWIVGFVIMGFITGIVFLVMAKGKKYVD